MINEAFHPLSSLDKELLHYFSVLGRAVFSAQQLEMNCRAIVGFLHMRDQSIIQGPSAIEDPKFQEWMDQLWKKTLGQHIKSLCEIYGFSNEISSIFEDARKARNSIAHEIAMGVIDRLESGPDQQIAEIKELVRKIAAADKIAAMVVHGLNRDPMPNLDFFVSYEDKVVAWVTEDTFKE